MEFWSKGLGKKTIAMALSKGESTVSEDAVCLRGVMEEPVSWEYVMLLDEADINDFFALLQEPGLARYVHASPNRWSLYAGLVKGGAQIAWRALVAAFGKGEGASLERVTVELPPPSAIAKKKKQKKKVLYRRRLSTTTLKAPTMTPSPSADAPAEAPQPAGV